MATSASVAEVSSREASTVQGQPAGNGATLSRVSSEHIRQQRLDHQAQSNLAHYGRTDKIVFIDTEKAREGRPHNHDSPSRFHMFFHRYNFGEFAKPPILHQWVQDGKLYREATERVSSRFELFFDLLFVAIVHQVAEPTAESPNGLSLARFILLFCPAFSVWGDVREIVNQFGNDDVTQRLYILWTMALLVGYSTNAAAIDLVPISHHLSDTSKLATRWTVGFIFVAKLSSAILNMIYAFFLPLSAEPLLVTASNRIFFALFFFAGIFVPSTALFVFIPVAVLSDMVLRFCGVVFAKWFERRSSTRMSSRTSTGTWSQATIIVQQGSEQSELFTSGSPQADFIVDGSKLTELERARKRIRLPAINIEHHVDRMSAFVTIVLGEMVANVFFNTDLVSGLSARCGRAILGLMVAFNINWIYFDSEACRCFVHALRRHWVTALLFTMLHLPLTLALLLASAAMSRLVMGGSHSSSAADAPATTSKGHEQVPPGIFWFFGGGLGVSIICIASIGLLHRAVEGGGRGGVFRITRPIVIGTRYIMGVLMILLPLAHKKLGPTKMLAVYVGITSFLIIEQTFARLERVEREQDQLREVIEKVEEQDRSEEI